MTKPNPSAEPPASPPPEFTPPEFFVDRGLGRKVPQHLTDLGWRIHLITAHFPNDAMNVADEDWIEYGLQRNWIPLCKDGQIRRRPIERAPLDDHKAVLFYLDNQQLNIGEMVRRIHNAQQAIYRHATRPGPAIYAINATGVRKTWP